MVKNDKFLSGYIQFKDVGQEERGRRQEDLCL